MCVPVARARALLHAVVWILASLILGVVAVQGFASLDFEGTGRDNRAGDWALAILLVPVAVAGALAFVHGVRWFALAVWPGVGIRVNDQRLQLGFGPFGNRSFDWKALDVKYFFEMDEEEHEGVFEAYLPEEQQRARYLPRIRTRAGGELLNIPMLRFLRRSEEEVAGHLGGAIQRWRDRIDDAGSQARL